MNKYYGKIADFVPLREEPTRFVASYGLTANDDGIHATWYELFFPKTQYASIGWDIIRNAIIDDIDARTDEKILTGYQWTVLHGEHAGQTVNVWLSTENQANYKAKHDLALAYPHLVTFPIRFKISEDAEKKAIYEEFQDISELATFYLGGVSYIEHCLDEGWKEKDAVKSDNQ